MSLANILPIAAPAFDAIHYVMLVGITFFVLVATRAVAKPHAGAMRFGLPLAHDGDDGFVRIYGLRNLTLAAILAGLILTSQLGALRLIFTGLLLLPVADVLIIAGRHGWSRVPRQHYVIEVYFLIVASWLWSLPV